MKGQRNPVRVDFGITFCVALASDNLWLTLLRCPTCPCHDVTDAVGPGAQPWAHTSHCTSTTCFHPSQL